MENTEYYKSYLLKLFRVFDGEIIYDLLGWGRAEFNFLILCKKKIDMQLVLN